MKILEFIEKNNLIFGHLSLKEKYSNDINKIYKNEKKNKYINIIIFYNVIKVRLLLIILLLFFSKNYFL